MKRILLFSLFWFILNLIQSYFTEIIDDEAYYWVYSKFLDWGYFDHPPVIALMVKLGYVFFQNELGVRLLSSLMGAGTVFLILYMLKDELRDLRLAMLLLLAVPLMHFHVAGSLATPDIPLVFFTTLFFFLYKRFVKDASLSNILMLALCIALMLYSKYHAFLVIGFIVLSNLRLLRRWRFWIIVILAGAFYLPHIIWQVKHDFVTFSYHLVERSRPFELKHILDYIGGQLLLLGPVTGTLLLILGIRKKTADPFTSSLKYTFLGIFIFFLVSSVRGHVEAHWTAAGYIPLLLYTLPLADRSKFFQKRGVLLAAVTLPLIVVIRLALIIDTDSVPDQLRKRFHGKEEAMQAIEARAGDRTVVFTNSYQNASVYWFFTGKPAFNYSNKHYHRTQYDLIGMEADLTGKQVLFITRHGFPGCDTLNTGIKEYIMHDVDYYCGYNRVVIRPPQLEWELIQSSEVEVSLTLFNPGNDTVFFNGPCTHLPQLMYSYFDKNRQNKTFYDSKAGPLPDLLPGAEERYTIRMKVPDSPGEYNILFSIGSKHIPPGINGKPVRMTVLARSTTNSGNN
ncbi:ArnT family glycosyltransferase [Bacteroidota bacterium]